MSPPPSLFPLEGEGTTQEQTCLKVDDVSLRVCDLPGWVGNVFSTALCERDVWLCFLCSAGMIEHDVIIGINGRPVHTMQDVSEAVQSGTAFSVVVRRKDGDVTLTIIPEETD